MTLPLNEVGARLILRDKAAFVASSTEAAAAVKRIGDAAETSGAKAAAAGSRFEAFTGKVKKTSAALITAGHKINHFVTLPVVALGAASVKSATDFQSAMMRIHTQAGGSIKDVRTLSKQVIALSSSAQQGPTELAKSLYHLKSVGMNNVDAMKALKESSDLAAVSGAGLEETTNALAGAWRTGIPGAKNFHQTVSSLNAIVGAGNMTMDQLIGALGTGILPAAKTFGLNLKDVGSALALFTDESVPANAAATRMRMTFALLGAPTKQAMQQLKSIGLGQYDLANDMRKKNGLIVAIGDLKTHLEASGLSATKQTALLTRAFGGGRSSAALLSLLNNYDVLEKKQKQVTKGASRFGEAVKAQLKTPEARFKLLISSLEQLGVKIGNKLIPYVLDLVKWLNKTLDWFNKLSPSTKKWIGYIILTVAAMGPLLSIVGKLAATLVFLAENPVVLVIAAIAALAFGLVYAYKHSETFRDIVNKVFDDVRKGATYLWIQVMKVWKAWGQPMFQLAINMVKLWWVINKPILQGVVKMWQWMWPLIKVAAKFVWAAIKMVGSVFLWVLTISGDVVRGINNHWDGVMSFFKALPGHLKDFFKGVGNILIWPFRTAFNLIATMWNDTLGKLKVPGWVKHIPGMGWAAGLGVPNIPLWHGGSGGGGATTPNEGAVHAGTGVTGKATGGVVHAGKSYFVGERGMELFQPKVSGVIVPNYRLQPELNKVAVSRQRAVTPQLYQQQASGRVDASMVGGGGDETIVIQIPLDGKILAETVYKHTRDKAARR